MTNEEIKIKNARTAEKIFMSKSPGNHIPIYGLILAGGKSSRMGYDKSVIEYHQKPQREYLFDLMRRFCGEVFTSCKATSEVPAYLNPLVDQFDIDSPLNGILSAFKQKSNVAWLAIAVDMPLVDEKTIEFLISARSTKHVATCFFDSEGKNPEPLLTIWEPNSTTLLNKFFKMGNKSPREFLKGSFVNTIKPINANVLTNINSTEELNNFLAKTLDT